jgi:hypothetical protein
MLFSPLQNLDVSAFIGVRRRPNPTYRLFLTTLSPKLPVTAGPTAGPNPAPDLVLSALIGVHRRPNLTFRPFPKTLSPNAGYITGIESPVTEGATY